MVNGRPVDGPAGRRNALPGGRQSNADRKGVVCQGRCPMCGRWVDLTWQRGGDVDRCVCGVEAVLIVETRDMLRWYWRDPLTLPDNTELHRLIGQAREQGDASPAWALGDSVQLQLFDPTAATND